MQLHAHSVDAGDTTVGVTGWPGLCCPGLTWQHTRGSALLGWVKDDAEYIAHQIDVGGCRSCCDERRARHRALGKLDPSPDVHVDDDADDLEHLLRAEVLDERVVESLERRVPIDVGRAAERLGVAERRPLGLGVKLSLPPCGQGVDLGPRDACTSRAAWWWS